MLNGGLLNETRVSHDVVMHDVVFLMLRCRQPTRRNDLFGFGHHVKNLQRFRKKCDNPDKDALLAMLAD